MPQKPYMSRIKIETPNTVQSIWLNGLTAGRIEIEATDTETDRFGIHLGPHADYQITFPIGTKISII